MYRSPQIPSLRYQVRDLYVFTTGNTIHKDKLSNLNGNMRSTTYMMTMRSMTKLMTNMYDAYIYNDEHKKYDFLLSPSRPNATGLDLAKLNRC